MRITTYIGLLMGGIVLYGVVRAKGGDFTIFTNTTALAVCLGGTIAAITLSSARTTILLAVNALSYLFWRKSVTSAAIANELVAVARQVKMQGTASIRPDESSLNYPYLNTGLQLVVDGVAPERIEDLMRLESEILSDKRRGAERMFKMMGTYSPMFGLIGTLIGLIHMLKDLTDPRAIGQGMAVALMATFYGVLLAGLIFLPIAAKIRTLEMEERLIRDETLAGLLAVRMGENPEHLRELLDVFTQKQKA